MERTDQTIVADSGDKNLAEFFVQKAFKTCLVFC